MTLAVLDVAAPVLARSAAGAAAGVVRGVTRRALYLDFDGFVVAVTGPDAPAVPNGVRLTARRSPGAAAPLGAPARLEHGGLRVAGHLVPWRTARPVVWDPQLATLAGALPAAARGRAILAALGARVPRLAARLPAALAGQDDLVGLGPGLTPEGDDLLAGAAAALAAAGTPVPLPDDLRARTTALSATLLELAVAGAAPAAARAIADPSCRDWRPALEELCSLGSSTGRAWVAGLAHGVLVAAHRHAIPTV